MDWSWIAQSVFSGVEWVDPQEITTFVWFIQQLRETFRNNVLSAYPVLRGELIVLFLIAFIATWYCLFKTGKLKFWEKFFVLFELWFEKIYEFFEGIIGKEQPRWIKSTVIGIFFVVFISNLCAACYDFIATAFPEWEFEEMITAPSTWLNFNIAMALCVVAFILIVQIAKKGFGKCIYAYLPVRWNDYVTVERGNKSLILYIPLKIVVKIFDIIISMFVGLLDIVWNIAKVISLSFRLTGNLMSWTILLFLLVGACSSLSQVIASVDFPIIFPLVLVIWGLFGAVVQAFVFGLLTAIFVKVAADE